jgi:acetoin utilization deacetylase AcuC-like enzyme
VDSLTFDSLGHLNLSHEGIKKRNELVFNFCKKQNTPVVVFMG